MICSIKNKIDLEDLDELADLQSEIKQFRLVEKLGKQGFHHDVKELIEPITKTDTDSCQKLFEEKNSEQKQLRHWINQIFM